MVQRRSQKLPREPSSSDIEAVLLHAILDDPLSTFELSCQEWPMTELALKPGMIRSDFGFWAQL